MSRHLGLLLGIAHTVFVTTAAAELDRILIYPNKVLGLGGGPVCHWSAVTSKGDGADRLVEFEVATGGFAAPKVQWRLPVYALQNGASATSVRRIGESRLDGEGRFRFHVSVSDLGRADDASAFRLEVSDDAGRRSHCTLERRVIASLLDVAAAPEQARASR
jgi:hypothetical protein